MSTLTQPPPKPGKTDVTEFILVEVRKRQELGRKKYGTSLQTWNGRDPYADAIEEELDRLQYLTQARLERAELLARMARFEAMARDCARDIERDCPGWAASWREVAP